MHQSEHYAVDGRDQFAPRRLISFAQVQDLLGGAHRTTVWRWWRSGLIPEPVRIGSRRLAWFEDEIQAAIARLQRVSGARPTA
jgi:predicted DNA-binding transcriptional regulator AlpA